MSRHATTLPHRSYSARTVRTVITMAPLISEDLPCEPEYVDLYMDDVGITKRPTFSKGSCETTPTGGIGYDLADIIREAVSTDRTTHGVFACAELLTSDPDSVMLCVLPDASNQCDPCVHIQHTLIQAFCWENEIQMIKVDCVNKLASLLEVRPSADAVCRQLSCLLIQHPSGDVTPEMERVSQYIDHVMFSDVYPKPVICIPE